VKVDLDRWSIQEIAARWGAVLFVEREAFLRFGTRHAPWESTPAYAARILKADRNISLENAAKVAAVFRAAYDELATP
jgi:hypothetical protein